MIQFFQKVQFQFLLVFQFNNDLIHGVLIFIIILEFILKEEKMIIFLWIWKAGERMEKVIVLDEYLDLTQCLLDPWVVLNILFMEGEYSSSYFPDQIFILVLKI